MLFLALGPAALVALMQTQRDDQSHLDLSWLLFGPDQLDVVRQAPSLVDKQETPPPPPRPSGAAPLPRRPAPGQAGEARR